MRKNAQRMKDLEKLLNRSNEKYRTGEPTPCSDTQFDRKLQELKELEEKHPDAARADSPTQRIGAEPPSGQSRVKHDVPMLSLENVFSIENLKKWLDAADKVFAKNKIGKPNWTIECKVDGVAGSLIYEKGILISARTRGDGVYGYDVTENAKTIPGIPQTWNSPERIEIRGEFYMPNSVFTDWNESYANSRAATAGAIRLLDPKECAKRPLAFIAHSIAVPKTSLGCTAQSSFLERMEQAGMTTPMIRMNVGGVEHVFHTSSEVLDFFERIDEWFDPNDRDYAVDGFVVKLDDFSLRRYFGETSKFPKWAIAPKFTKYEAETTLLKVIFQIGKTGVCTPVGELEPVEIDGTTVSRVSLHNMDVIERLDIRIGDTLLIEKAGKIIPHVVKHIARGKKSKKITPPDHCPECNASLVT